MQRGRAREKPLYVLGEGLAGGGSGCRRTSYLAIASQSAACTTPWVAHATISATLRSRSRAFAAAMAARSAPHMRACVASSVGSGSPFFSQMRRSRRKTYAHSSRRTVSATKPEQDGERVRQGGKELWPHNCEMTQAAHTRAPGR